MKERNTSLKAYHHSDSGFTLMELMVIIVILSVVALLVFPKMSNNGNADLRSSARSVAASLRYLEDKAVTTKTTYRMSIDMDDSSIHVTRILPDGVEQPDDDVFFSGKLLADDITVSDVITSRLGKVSVGDVQLAFTPMGLRELATIHLRSKNDRFYTVRAYPRNNRVKVFENYSGGTM
jgi:general secretion pathway protein H